MFKGAASTSLVLIVLGMVLGSLITNRLSDILVNEQAGQAWTTQEDAGDVAPKVFLPVSGSVEEQLVGHDGSVEDCEEPAVPNDKTAMLEAERLRLAEWEASLRDQQARLDTRLTTLESMEAQVREEQSRLEDAWAVLQTEMTELNEQRRQNNETRTLLEAERTRLDNERARLAEQEERTYGLLRWALVALAVSGLMAVPSVLALVTLARRGSPGSNGGVSSTMPGRMSANKQTPRRARPSASFPTAVCDGQHSGLV